MESVAWPYRRDCVRVGHRAERAASRGANSQFLEVTERNKYLVMICRGHVPVVGRGDKGAPINKDIKPFLLYFLPKGSSLDWHTMNVIVKHFHLAFKGMETGEIYDVLMEQLVATIKGYDPTYTEKVKLLVEAIENGLSKRKQFSFADVNRHLDFDCNRYIRLLGRLGCFFSEAQRPAGSIKQFIAGRRSTHRTTF
jgi:hypothetical protein